MAPLCCRRCSMRTTWPARRPRSTAAKQTLPLPRTSVVATPSVDAAPSCPPAAVADAPLQKPFASRPMFICVQEGLCNRIRAVLSYWQVAQLEQQELIVAWPANEFCNGEFLDLFEPIKGIRFVFTPDDLPNGLRLGAKALRGPHMPCARSCTQICTCTCTCNLRSVTPESVVFECHPRIKGTAAEAKGYAHLVPRCAPLHPTCLCSRGVCI